MNDFRSEGWISRHTTRWEQLKAGGIKLTGLESTRHLCLPFHVAHPVRGMVFMVFWNGPLYDIGLPFPLYRPIAP